MNSEWQPIETAPRDGTEILIGNPREVFIGYWDTSSQQWLHDEYGPVDPEDATRWQPLPDPPTEDE